MIPFKLMSLPALTLLALFPLATVLSASGAVSQDARAVSILNSCVTASGGATAIASIHDFTVSGTITYNWADQQVQGQATAKGLGLHQFRLDGVLQAGTQSWVAGDWSGSSKGTDGTITKIPYSNNVNRGALTFPVTKIAAALADPTENITYVGLVNLNGVQAQQIRIQPLFAAQDDPDGVLSQWGTVDYFIDATSFLLVKNQDTFYSPDNPADTHSRETYFANYQALNGVVLPMSVSEKFSGQATWTLQITSVAFNTGLSSADFQLQ